MLLLHRPWAAAWELRDSDLDEAAARVDALYEVSARTGAERTGGRGAESTADRELLEALLDDLDVPAAVAIALESGGSTARALLKVLALE
jgi:cysteinyl-tRNA synthetase